MNKKKIILLPEEMKEIAGYEADFTKFVSLPEDYDDIDLAYDREVAPDFVRGLPATEEEIFADIWSKLEDEWTLRDDEERISDIRIFRIGQPHPLCLGARA